jgi:patatin-like phospholipase/acyl hydrolase
MRTTAETERPAVDRKFRILSLDGGGIKGAFTAAALALLEERTGRRAVDHFDLITGTSTGGILAIGLGLGFSATELMNFYIEAGPTIFPSTGITSRLGWFRQLFGPKHSHAVLRQALVEILGNRRFGDSRCRLAIPTYDAIKGRIYIMKTCHHPDLDFAISDAAAVDVALATSAAPTFFEAATFPSQMGADYVDGGVWANCPAMVGVAEAIAFLGRTPADIDVLSIGTTSTPFSIAAKRKAGAAGWSAGILQLMFQAQVEAARAQSKLIAGGFHRIDASVVAGEFTLDRAHPDTIRKLVVHGRGEAAKKENLRVVETRFLDGNLAEPYEDYSVSRVAEEARR